MKRTTWKIACIGLIFFNFVFLFVSKKTNILSDDLRMIFVGVFILLLAFIIISFGGIQVIKFYIESVKNMRSCGDSFFDELDEYKQHCGETTEYYQDVIRAIAFYYLPNGNVDKVVGKDLKRLFNREEFLIRELRMGEHFISCITSLGVSVAATVLIALEFKSDSQDLINILIGFFVFFAMLLLPYNNVTKGRASEIYNFELQLLQKKIEKVEETLCNSAMNEELMRTKKNVLNVLGDKYVVAIRKSKEIRADIRVIEKLDLHEGDIANYETVSFIIGKTKKSGVLLFDDKNQLANVAYKKLYKILRKYNLIYRIESEEE